MNIEKSTNKKIPKIRKLPRKLLKKRKKITPSIVPNVPGIKGI
jgi:hypothetical protein